MLLIRPRSREYADVLELALYNAVLVGVSLDGKKFFYENPPATVGKRYERSAWFDCSCCCVCCPENLFEGETSNIDDGRSLIDNPPCSCFGEITPYGSTEGEPGALPSEVDAGSAVVLFELGKGRAPGPG